MTKVSHDSEIPAVGQQVITACAFIWRDHDGEKQVFMPRRAATKKFLPGIYELPGGHIDFGEDLIKGLQREIYEELGMTIAVGDSFATFTYTNEVKGSHSVEIIYFAQFIEPFEQITIEPEDHSEFGWFSRQAVEANRPVIIANEAAGGDIEYRAILHGFDLLEGQTLSFS